MRPLVQAPLLALALGGACNPAGEEYGPCGSVTSNTPAEPGVHFAQGTPLTWATNPPSGGPHYPVWAPWAQAFDGPVPRGNYVHNLEHGGVVLLYRCPQGCPEVAAALREIGRSLPQDGQCQAPINARWLLSPDPLMPEDVQVAAVAWGWLYRAACLDAGSLRDFALRHYNQATEDTCADGAISWP